MSWSGTLLPAAMPVRSFSNPWSGIRPDSSSSSSDMNIVGTPCSAVQPCSCTALRVAAGSKHSAGKTIDEPVSLRQFPPDLSQQHAETNRG